jgi:hypothetical protein
VTKFYVTKRGGIKDPETQELRLLEGSKDKGPWYVVDAFSPEDINRWISKNHIKVCSKVK